MSRRSSGARARSSVGQVMIQLDWEKMEIFKITNCDHKQRRGARRPPRHAPQVSASRLHRAGRRHAFLRAAKQARRAGQYRNHARLRATAYPARLQRRSGAKAPRPRKEVRHPVQGRVRRHPGTDGAAGAKAQAADRIHFRRLGDRVREYTPEISGRMFLFPIPPPSQQRKIQTQLYTARIRQSSGIAFELRAVALALCVEEAFQVGALVAAGLVVNDPAHMLRRAEDAIHDVGVRPGSAWHADAMLAACFWMRTENPATALV